MSIINEMVFFWGGGDDSNNGCLRDDINNGDSVRNSSGLRMKKTNNEDYLKKSLFDLPICSLHISPSVHISTGLDMYMFVHLSYLLWL